MNKTLKRLNEDLNNTKSSVEFPKMLDYSRSSGEGFF